MEIVERGLQKLIERNTAGPFGYCSRGALPFFDGIFLTGDSFGDIEVQYLLGMMDGNLFSSVGSLLRAKIEDQRKVNRAVCEIGELGFLLIGEVDCFRYSQTPDDVSQELKEYLLELQRRGLKYKTIPSTNKEELKLLGKKV